MLSFRIRHGLIGWTPKGPKQRERGAREKEIIVTWTAGAGDADESASDADGSTMAAGRTPGDAR